MLDAAEPDRLYRPGSTELGADPNLGREQRPVGWV
jgi:hypothetical protein